MRVSAFGISYVGLVIATCRCRCRIEVIGVDSGDAF